MQTYRQTHVGALVVLLLVFSAGAAAGSDDDVAPPLAEARAGTAVAYFDPSEVYHRRLEVRWMERDGLALFAPREASSVRITLLPELTDFADIVDHATVSATRSSGDPMRLGTVALDLESSRDVVVDLPSMLEEAANQGEPGLESIQVWMLADTPQASLWLWIELVLTDEPATGEVVHELTMPDRSLTSSTDLYEYHARPTGRVGPGTALLVRAPGEFWTYDVTEPITLALANAYGEYATLVPEISADGATLQVTLPSGLLEYSRLVVEFGRSAALDIHIEVWFSPPWPDDVQAYVTAVYNDLFGRDPDPGGLATWTRLLRAGTPYGAVADAITGSDEFRSGLIRDAYAWYLGRAPDPDGLAYWLSQMRRGMHIQQMEAGFLSSPEYYQLAGGTDAAWVRWLYLDVLGREPALAEVQYWVPVVRAQGRNAVAQGFLYSTEKLTTDVDAYYQWLLRRHLDPSGRVTWVRAIQSGTRVEVIVAAIISSPEYRNNVPVG